MKYETINLKKHFPLKYDTDLICYALDNSKEIEINRKHQAVLVFPGGGYGLVSDREAEPICMQFLAADICAFTLKYSIIPEKTIYPNVILEAIAALAYLHDNAEKYNIDPDKISVIGFSAGGHLAGTLSGFYNSEEFLSMLNLKPGKLKLYSCLLAYPVISFKEDFTNTWTCFNFTNNNKELMEKFSVENCVSRDFPRTFIWATRDDDTVDIRNTILLMTALQKNDIEFEVHVYPKGPHGLSLANQSTAHPSSVNLVVERIQPWIKMAIEFLKMN